VVAVPGSYLVGFARLAELLEGVLPHGFEHSVTGSAACTFGDGERFVDEQAELVEHLEAFDVRTAGDGLGSVEIESTHERRQPAEEHLLGFG